MSRSIVNLFDGGADKSNTDSYSDISTSAPLSDVEEEEDFGNVGVKAKGKMLESQLSGFIGRGGVRDDGFSYFRGDKPAPKQPQQEEEPGTSKDSAVRGKLEILLEPEPEESYNTLLMSLDSGFKPAGPERRGGSPDADRFRAPSSILEYPVEEEEEEFVFRNELLTSSTVTSSDDDYVLFKGGAEEEEYGQWGGEEEWHNY